MSGSRGRRLARLERDLEPPARTMYVWRHVPAESREEAIARAFPEGVPPDVQLVICSWQWPAAPVHDPGDPDAAG